MILEVEGTLDFWLLDAQRGVYIAKPCHHLHPQTITLADTISRANTKNGPLIVASQNDKMLAQNPRKYINLFWRGALQ